MVDSVTRHSAAKKEVEQISGYLMSGFGAVAGPPAVSPRSDDAAAFGGWSFPVTVSSLLQPSNEIATAITSIRRMPVILPP